MGCIIWAKALDRGVFCAVGSMGVPYASPPEPFSTPMAAPPCASRPGAWPEGWGQQGADFFRGTMGSQDLRQDIEGPRVKVVG